MWQLQDCTLFSATGILVLVAVLLLGRLWGLPYASQFKYTLTLIWNSLLRVFDFGTLGQPDIVLLLGWLWFNLPPFGKGYLL